MTNGSRAPARLDELPTPCLVLDRSILQRNLDRMRGIAQRHGVLLRPHLKTAKSAEVARRATDGGPRAITVSTLAEAEYFASYGFRDITLGAGITPGKLERASRIVAQGASLTLITDDVDAASAIATQPADFRALVEIDSGDARGGVAPLSTALLEIGRALGGKLRGVLTHGGHSYACRTLDAIQEVAEQERTAVVSAAERLRDAGLNCETVSVGSTPTVTHARSMAGVTEVRPGVYMFGDLFQAEIRSCSTDDIAVSVLASVIGRHSEDDRFLVDAGSLALSKDRSTAETPHDAGYGLVVEIDGKALDRPCVITRAYQEHGVADGGGEIPWDRLSVGAKVRILPNHSCLTAAAYDRYFVVDGGPEVVDIWDRVNGW